MYFTRVASVFLLLLCSSGCEQGPFTHEDDDYEARYKAGWHRTIGTDCNAGNNEYLYFNDLPMEWSCRESGSGYLYAVDPHPGADAIMWSFDGHPKGETIMVKDGATLICTHASGAKFEVEFIKQTSYYIKVLFREKREPVAEQAKAPK